jgi:dTDP-4-dehydrorhamnose 3,5-epimerase
VKVLPTSLPGLLIIEPRVFADARGFFYESYSVQSFAEHGLPACNFIQDNHARSEAAGVLRGLHFQLPPEAQAKLVRVTRGRVHDVAVDLRKGSPTYGQWEAVELSADNFRQLFIPKGFAHGYLTLEPGVEFQYKVDAPYAPDLDAGILWNDPELGIPWPVQHPVLSAKDQTLGLFKDFDSPFIFPS